MVGSVVAADGVRTIARLRVKSADPIKKDACMMDVFSVVSLLEGIRPCTRGE